MVGDHRDNVWQRLTPREREICRILAQGRSNRDIAAELGISVSTVQNHVHHILRKFGVPTRRQLMAGYRWSPRSVH